MKGEGKMKPNRPQRKFFESKKRIRCLIAANKIGKTTAACADLANFALQGGKVCRVISNLGFQRGIQEVIIPELMKWIPRSRIVGEPKKNSQGIVIKIILRGDNGQDSVITFMSGDQDDMTFEGDIADYVWIDEPGRKAIYTAMLRALLVTCGKMVMTLTPLSEPWIYNDLYCSTDEEIECIEGTLWDACVDNGGHLSKDQIEDFISKLPEDEKEARVFGKFRHLVGRVFKAFDPLKHIVKPFYIPNDWPVYYAVDPHQRKPHAALFMAVSPENDWFICNEVYFAAGIEDFGKEVKKVCDQYRIAKGVIDTSSETPDWQRRETARSILQRVGLRLELARKKNQKEASRMLIKQALEGKDGTGIPWLFVFENCKRTIFEFLNYVWDDYNDPHKQGLKEEPRKVNDDLLDDLHYIVAEKPRYGTPEILVRKSDYGATEYARSY